MTREQAARLASNQTLFRAVNDKMAVLNEVFAADDGESDVGVVCECSRLDCAEQIAITASEYADVRKDPSHFVVAASEEHVVPEVEDVVSRTDRYFVVERKAR